MVTDLISYEPATGAELWRGKTGDIDREVSAAREAWPRWAASSLSERLTVIRAVASRMRGETEKLADLIARETGKPLWEARAEIEGVIERVDISVKAYADRSSQRRVDGKPGVRSALRHKPHGVLAVITPFNMPVLIPAGHIIPALVAGNAVVFKPSEKVPATSQFLIDLFHKTGIPPGVVRIVQGNGEAGRKLSEHPGIDGTLFTGSANSGIQLHRQSANRPDKLLSLEMGGNNPIIVWDTKDIHSAAVLIVQSAFLSAGQRCTAARRLIVKDELFDVVVSEVKRLADRLVIGDPHGEPAPFMGPVIDNDTADGLTESFVALMSHGGRPIKHMARPIKDRPFLTPGIIDVSTMIERPDIELFGPLLQCVRVPDFEMAIDEANNTRFGLTTALIGGSPEQYNQFWANSRAGIVNWNAATNGSIGQAPCGGVGLSGNCRPGGYYSADQVAYPVVSSENEIPKGMIGIGLKADEFDGTSLG
ncbi:succinylglutamate-semialdehyde dehydrogenase [Sphingorhabdus arenilitoris]|uniref:Succinylglutamate-semialdehyde dehydrogenase n=1 Tax=Sphingorhabdus arenilitoris TaxID=1490041 RepID=A0ABV8RHY0_9SPHN